MSTETANTSEGLWVATSRFSEDGDWIVHQIGLNRPHKIAYCGTRENAEQVAAALNGVAQAIAAEREAIIALLQTFPFCSEGCGRCVEGCIQQVEEAIRARGEVKMSNATPEPEFSERLKQVTDVAASMYLREMEGQEEKQFFLDGNEHIEGAKCWCTPRRCDTPLCSGYVHRQSVYGPSIIYICDTCKRDADYRAYRKADNEPTDQI